jgi:hypothetical protein
VKSTFDGLPHPTSFRPQRFSRSRRLTPPRALWACFIPQPRPGFTLQGLSPLPSRLASSTSRALMSLASISSQRVAPLVPDPLASPSGHQSRQRSVMANKGFRPANHSIPSWAFNSCGLFSGYLGGAFTPPPLVTFPAERSLSTRHWPSAYQSVSDLAFCLQTAFPFEICDLLFREARASLLS